MNTCVNIIHLILLPVVTLIIVLALVIIFIGTLILLIVPKHKHPEDAWSINRKMLNYITNFLV